MSKMTTISLKAPKLWAFHNSGNVYFFSPNKTAVTVDGGVATLKEIHKQLVRDAKRKDCFLVNEDGASVDCANYA